MTRFLLTAAAALLIAAPVAAQAATGHSRHATKPHVTTVAAKHGKKTAKPAPRAARPGSDATDALNEQSLNRTRGQ